jgi:hypothetical protein
MAWILSKAPAGYSGPVLSEDDIGTIKIALASAATTEMDFWGRVYDLKGSSNIYDRALDLVMEMEEAEPSLDTLDFADERIDLGIRDAAPLFGGIEQPSSWFGSLFNFLRI